MKDPQPSEGRGFRIRAVRRGDRRTSHSGRGRSPGGVRSRPPCCPNGRSDRLGQPYRRGTGDEDPVPRLQGVRGDVRVGPNHVIKLDTVARCDIPEGIALCGGMQEAIDGRNPEFVADLNRDPRLEVSVGNPMSETGLLGASHGHAGHLAARIGAALALGSATLAVLILEAGTLLAAGIADVGTEPAELLSVVAPPGHPAGGLSADVGAVVEQHHAMGTGRCVRLLHAGGRAVLALDGTLLAGIDASLVLLVHNGHLLVENAS